MEGADNLDRFLSEMERLNTNEILSDEYNKIPLDKLQILGTDVLERVDGPMREKHLSMMLNCRVQRNYCILGTVKVGQILPIVWGMPCEEGKHNE
jgi:hypothetical protein